jgi:hypothetical protein
MTRRFILSILCAGAIAASPGRAGAQGSPSPANTGSDAWYAYVDGRIAENASFSATPTYLTDPELDDYKPVPSPDGSQIAFFRAID